MVDFFPRQTLLGVDLEKLDDEVEEFTTLGLGIVITIFGIMLYTRGRTHDLWTMFYVLQMLCYLTIYDVPLPASAQAFLEVISKHINFYLISPLAIIKLFKPDFEFEHAWSQKDVSIRQST
jgi:hypothetical protein